MRKREQCYAVSLDTSIGIRRGIMCVRWSGEHITGEMDILKHREAFEGVVGKDGHCQIRGQIVSLTKVLPYQAEGILSDDGVQLIVHTKKDQYELTGVPLKKEGDQ